MSTSDNQSPAEAAVREADILIWDGGNNDFPFFRPDLTIAVADSLRSDQVDTHHPGETVARMAYLTEQINPKAPRLKDSLIRKHYERKHGPDSYYGQ